MQKYSKHLNKILVAAFILLNLFFISPALANEDSGFTVAIPSKVAELEKFPINILVLDPQITSSANHLMITYVCREGNTYGPSDATGEFMYPDLREGFNYGGESNLNLEAVIEDPQNKLPENGMPCELKVTFKGKTYDEATGIYRDAGFNRELTVPFQAVKTELTINKPPYEPLYNPTIAEVGHRFPQLIASYDDLDSSENYDFIGVDYYNHYFEVSTYDYDTFVEDITSGTTKNRIKYESFGDYFDRKKLRLYFQLSDENRLETTSIAAFDKATHGLVEEKKEYRQNNGQYVNENSQIVYGMSFIFFRDDGLHISGRIEKKGYVPRGSEEQFYAEAKSEFEDRINSIKFSKVGEQVTTHGAPDRPAESPVIFEPENDCVKEPSVEPGDVQTGFIIRPVLSKKSIRNAITETGILRAYVTIELTDKNGRKIDACEIKEPGLSGKTILQAEFTNDKVYAGFTGGNILDSRQKTWPCEVDLASEGEFQCTFIISPNDVKKIVGQVGVVTENIALKIGETEEKVEITLTPAGPKVDFKTGSKELQQDSVKAIRFTVDDSDSKVSLVKVKLLGPGSLFQTSGNVVGGAESASKESAWLETRYVFLSGKPGVEQEVGYKAPPIGNFDIGDAINSLSMTDLQTDAGKQILKDAALAYGEQYLGDLDKASTYEQAGARVLGKYYRANPAKYAGKFKDAASTLVAARKQADNLKLVNNAYAAGNGLYTLSELPGGIEGTSKSMGTAAGVEEGSGGQTTTERVANVGIYAIDIAQMGVSILTYVPNKIPGVSKISAGVKTSFSAATNIWKANFKYIAQAEKIDRAKELFIPVLITVTAGDESGWEITYVLTLKVAYHQVN